MNRNFYYDRKEQKRLETERADRVYYQRKLETRL